jgi:beta-glucosidase/6-phospho-beta-glucosidase/beta-galactosidase
MPAAAADRDGVRVPEGFSFGVATSGFQVEGGFNGQGEPRNNWFEWERRKDVEPCGIACDSWRRSEEDLELAGSLGIDGYRMGIEWARVQPSTSTDEHEPPFDQTAVDQYASIITSARSRGMEPLATLHHFTHPRWLGLDFWQRADSPRVFAGYVRETVMRLGDALTRLQQPPLTRYVTLNELNVFPLITWTLGLFPPGETMKLGKASRASDHLLGAHVLAYDAIHDVYEQRRWPTPTVTTNNYSMSAYEMDRLFVDVLLARSRGVARADLAGDLKERRRRWHETLRRIPGPSSAAAERVQRTLVRATAATAFPVATAAVYASPRERTLDAIAVDIYAPWAKGRFRRPGHRTSGGTNPRPGRALWDDPPMPGSFGGFVRANVEPGLPVWVLENGLCNRVKRRVSYPRLDGWSRVRYLREHLGELARLISRGVPVTSYVHWSLLDNYEWGSYQPRFGIFGVVRHENLRRLRSDSLGDDAAGTYRRIVSALRSGEGVSTALA